MTTRSTDSSSIWSHPSIPVQMGGPYWYRHNVISPQHYRLPPRKVKNVPSLSLAMPLFSFPLLLTSLSLGGVNIRPVVFQVFENVESSLGQSLQRLVVLGMSSSPIKSLFQFIDGQEVPPPTRPESRVTPLSLCNETPDFLEAFRNCIPSSPFWSLMSPCDSWDHPLSGEELTPVTSVFL